MTNNDDSTTIAYQMMFLAKGKLPPWLLLAAVLHSPNAMAHSIVPADGVTAIAVASEQNDGLRGDRYLVSVMPIYADLTFIPKYQEVPPDKRGRAHIEILSFTMSMRRDSEDVEMEKFDLLNMAFFQPDYQIGGILPKTNSIKLVLGHVRRETAKGSVIDAARLNIGEGFCAGYENIFLAYLMLEVDLQASGELEEGYAAGPAVSLGFMFDPVPGLGLGVNARGVEFMYGEKERDVSLSMTGQIIISRNLKAQLNVNRTMLDEREVSNASFRIMLSYNYN